MTEMALKMLMKKENDKGFFLLVEAGRIDHAHHSNRGRQQADETVEFARAVELAKIMTNSEDTLIVVSADHSHVMTYAGYPTRRNPVTGIADQFIGSDGLPYETLSYANGPTYPNTFLGGNRRDITNDDFTARRRGYGSMVPRSSETHAGEDVSVYADGPWAHLLTGSFEQSVIPIVMAYAAGIGPYAKGLPINPFVNEKM
jgi:alkaline phosphatase